MKSMIVLLVFMLHVFQEVPTGKHFVDVINIDGAINPPVAAFIHDGIKKAEEENSECLVIKLNTPGGLLKSTRLIVSDMLTSNVPVIIYVYPAGAQAASAGVFITLAANISAMTPGTNIGAAHPVMMSEGGVQNRKDSLDIMMEKATNDAAAFIRSIAEKRHRNIEWAEKAVRQSVSLTETEALKENIIDMIAKNLDSLLVQLNSRTVETAAGTKTLHTQNAQVRLIEMNAIEKFLDIISDPNIAYILMMIAIYGLIFELSNPGSIFPGIVGVISLILAFYSMHTLPINYAGLALIIFAVILFIAEIKIVSHGLLTAGGIISFAIGSLMLINTDASYEFVHLSLSVIITVTVLTTLFFVFALGKGIAAQRRQPATGGEGLIGETGKALTLINPERPGQVMVHGEIWNAESKGDEIEEGTKIKVTELKDLNVIVKKTS
ncbi:MAG: nodulation protein NfeD [Ignavibacteriales bacterium]|nr:nodulation protein NfeD [Ignavibacteriales bacterium]